MSPRQSRGSHKMVEVVFICPRGDFNHNIHNFLSRLLINLCPGIHKRQEKYKIIILCEIFRRLEIFWHTYYKTAKFWLVHVIESYLINELHHHHTVKSHLNRSRSPIEPAPFEKSFYRIRVRIVPAF